MKSDISRHTFRPENHYSSVRQQQGRVQLDADWNEQADIHSHLDETTRRDVIGECCVPASTPDGFKIGEARDQLGAPARDLTIGLGRIYAGGILCENEASFVPMVVVEQTVDKVVTRMAELPALAQNGRNFEIGQWVELPADGEFRQREIEEVVIATRRLRFSTSFSQGGLLEPFRLRRLSTYLTQADYPNALQHDGVSGSGTYLAYLDVWRRHITALEDPGIRETALGGPDTTTRTKTIWQVKLFPVRGAQRIIDCNSEFPDWQEHIAPSDGQLTARTRPVEPAKDECSLPPGAGYSGVEHHTYRVEIHNGSHPGGATFKWSRDNGSLTYPIEEFVTDAGVTNGVQVAHLGRDEPTSLREGDWVEVLDEDTELAGNPGVLSQIAKIDRAERIVTLNDSLNSLDAGGNRKRFRKLRRWDMTGDEISLAKVAADNDGYVKLEKGVEVRFTAGNYRTGDYWIIPARSAATAAYIEWPHDAAGNPVPQPPLGIKHHYCRLAVVRVSRVQNGTAQFNVTHDCRKVFGTLTPDARFRVQQVFVTRNDSRVELANDTSIFADMLQGIEIKCSEDVSKAAVEQKPVCDVTLEIPLPLANTSAVPDMGLGFQPLTLDARLSVNGDKIHWKSSEKVEKWLGGNIASLFEFLAKENLPVQILAHLTLRGNFIWAEDAPQRLLDGDTFGAPAKRDRTELQLPSGDGRNGGDFRMWFRLVERVSLESVTFDDDEVTAGDSIFGTVTLSNEAAMKTEVFLTVLPASAANLVEFQPHPVVVKQSDETARFTMATKFADKTDIAVQGAIGEEQQGTPGLIDILPPLDAVFVFGGGPVMSGTSFTLSIVLTHRPPGGASVRMTVEPPAARKLINLHNKELLVADGNISQDFEIETQRSNSTLTVTITGNYRTINRETTFQLTRVVQ